MDIKPIRSKAAYQKAMARIDALWGAPMGSAEGDELEILAVLVERYEAEHEPMPPPDPMRPA